MANWEILEYNPDRVQTGLASAYSNTINGNNTKLVEVIGNIDNNIKEVPQVLVSTSEPTRLDGSPLKTGDIWLQITT